MTGHQDMTQGRAAARWRAIRAAAADATVPFALAAMFWGLMIVMVVVATAEGKDSPMTAFFTAFGAVGQVFFAWMVYRLGRQQLELTRQIADRQAKIDTFTLRSALFDEYVALRKSLGSRVVNEAAVFTLWRLTSRMGRLFPKPTMVAVDAYAERIMDLVEAKEKEDDILNGRDAGDIAAARNERIAIGKEVRTLSSAAYKSLQEDLHIG